MCTGFCWKIQRLVSACRECLVRTAAAWGNCYRSLQLPCVFTLSQQTKLSPCSSYAGCRQILIMVFAFGLRARVCTDGAKKKSRWLNQHLHVQRKEPSIFWSFVWHTKRNGKKIGKVRAKPWYHNFLFRSDFEMDTHVHSFATRSELKLISKTKSSSDFACCSFQAAASTAGTCGCTTPSSTCGSEWRLSTKAAGGTRWASCWARYGGSTPKRGDSTAAESVFEFTSRWL